MDIKTIKYLINHYEERSQKISDNFEIRSKFGYSQHDTYKLAMIKEFLNFLYGLDETEEIRRMKRSSELAWMRVRRYVEGAMNEISRHLPEDLEDLEKDPDEEEVEE